jgi:predicted N-acetyltransferase YhbS
MSAVAETRLPDGAVVRAASSDSDISAALHIEADREGDDDAFDLELVANTPGGLERISVVEKDGEILSIATLLDEQVRVGSTTIAAGQVEMVATRRDAEGRGYVRALMDRCHQLSAARGDVLQVMIGIPNFYRQFGYHYSVAMHAWHPLSSALTSDEGFAVRSATVDDLTVVRALQSAAQEQYDVAMPHSDECWRWLLTHRSSAQWLVEGADGVAHGLARVLLDDESAYVGELTADSAAATQALLQHVTAQTAEGGSVTVQHRPHVPGLTGLLGEPARREWYYLRTQSPADVLRALAPELLRRVHASGRQSGEALVSFYRSHVRLTWDADRLDVVEGGPLQAPVWAGGSGVPLDAFGALVVGEGAAALESRFPDALLGRQAELMCELFPPQRSDFLTFYLPA